MYPTFSIHFCRNSAHFPANTEVEKARHGPFKAYAAVRHLLLTDPVGFFNSVGVKIKD